METPTVPDSKSPEQWLAWMSDHPYLTQAIDTAVEAEMHYQLLAYMVGKWEAEHRADELAERITTVTRRALESVR